MLASSLFLQDSKIVSNQAHNGVIWTHPTSFPTAIAGGGVYLIMSYALFRNVHVFGHSTSGGNGAALGSFESIVDLRYSD